MEDTKHTRKRSRAYERDVSAENEDLVPSETCLTVFLLKNIKADASQNVQAAIFHAMKAQQGLQLPSKTFSE